MPTIEEANQLLQLLDITQKAVHIVVAEWQKQPPSSNQNTDLPSRELFDARRTVIAATGKLVELVASPSESLIEVTSQYNESRCLHIVTALRVPDLLAKAGESGLAIEKLSADVGIETRKLCTLPCFFLLSK